MGRTSTVTAYFRHPFRSEHGTRVMFTPSAAANETAVSDDLKDEGGVRDCRWMQTAQKLLESNK